MPEHSQEQARQHVIEQFKIGLQQVKKYIAVGEDRSEITTGSDGWKEVHIHHDAPISHFAFGCVLQNIDGITHETDPNHQDWVIIRWDPKVFGE